MTTENNVFVEDFSDKFWTYNINFSGLKDWTGGKIRDITNDVELRTDTQLLKDIDLNKRHLLAVKYLSSDIDSWIELDIADALEKSGVWWNVIYGIDENYILLKFTEYERGSVIFNYIPMTSVFIYYENAIIPCNKLSEELIGSKIRGDHQYIFDSKSTSLKEVFALPTDSTPFKLQEITPNIIDDLISEDYELAQKMWMRGYFDFLDAVNKDYVFKRLYEQYMYYNQFI